MVNLISGVMMTYASSSRMELPSRWVALVFGSMLSFTIVYILMMNYPITSGRNLDG